MQNAFKHVDRNHDGFITSCDARDFMADNGFYATDREIRGFMHRLDRDGDGRICFREFVDELKPRLPMAPRCI
jgi:Ca2+-binding EF-hand superfamily protein